jgi:hypothetical protein
MFKDILNKFVVFQFQTFPNERILFSNTNKFGMRIVLALFPWCFFLPKFATSLLFFYLARRTLFVWIKQRKPGMCSTSCLYCTFYSDYFTHA